MEAGFSPTRMKVMAGGVSWIADTCFLRSLMIAQEIWVPSMISIGRNYNLFSKY